MSQRSLFGILTFTVVAALGACSDEIAGPEPALQGHSLRASVSSADADLEDSHTGSFSVRYPEFVCTLDGGPVVIEGSVDIHAMGPGDAAMIGLIDKGLHEADPDPVAAWGSGAYVYLGHIGDNLRVGPTDGFDGGEINQVGTNVAGFFDNLPATVDFTLTIDPSTQKVTVHYDGLDYVDDYGDIEAANTADAYPGGEFDGGAIIGVDIFDTPVDVTYRLQFVSGCAGGDDEGPVTANVTADPNPVQNGTPFTLTADVDDTATGGSAIASAEYSLDAGPWIAMDAADGTFDEVVEAVTAAVGAPAEAGIYDLCVRGTDEPGNVGPEACTMLVVYDPTGGFVTGGGWIDSPSGAFMPSDTDVVTESDIDEQTDASIDWLRFETGAGNGAFVNGPGLPPLGTGSFEMTSTSGGDKVTLFNYDHVGTLLSDIESITYATYRSSTSTNPPAQYPALNIQVDFVGDGSSFTTLVWEPVYAYGAGALQTDAWQTWDAMAPSQAAFEGGWWSTNAIPGVCAFSCYVSWETIVANNPDAKVKFGFGVNIGSGWNGTFSGNVDALSVAVDGVTTTYDFELTAPADPVGKANFGFVSRYKKGASTPDGNTEFVFQNADLNFHSSSYDWLVINQGGANAQFKGWGTVNGAGTYGFMLWAGDGTGPNGEDTFRIKITDVGDGIVYDNGMHQPIGGGSIKVHKK